jgi:uncharacterized damage-inducible protein DinB
MKRNEIERRENGRTEIDRIGEQVQRSFSGEAWHGPCVLDALEGVDTKIASAKPLQGGHSIAELAAHLSLVTQLVIERVEGRGRRIKSDADYWPDVPDVLSETQWKAMQVELKERAELLEKAIAGFAVEKLDEQLMEGGSSAANNFLGHAQHNAYHAGQIMMLKKLARCG